MYALSLICFVLFFSMPKMLLASLLKRQYSHKNDGGSICRIKKECQAFLLSCLHFIFISDRQ